MVSGERTEALTRTMTEGASAHEAQALLRIAPGDILSGRFEVVRQLGQGGTGVVFEVTDLESGESLALKALRAPRAGRAHLIKAEFRVVQGLDHPRLVRLHELYVIDDCAYLTMDLVRGTPLTAATARRAREKGGWGEVRALLVQCAEAVQALHGAGVIHRDLKPGNVLVDDAGRVTVLDFGLTDEDGSLLRGSGTRAYMAPEQRAGDALTPAADWFAFGVMLHELLFGELPRERSTKQDAPADLKALCARLLVASPERRPSGAEVLAVLSDACAPKPPGELFVGRVTQLQSLRDALSRAGPRIVLLSGADGAGKTTLVRRALSGALHGDVDTLVLKGRCSAFESVRFNAFDPIIDALLPHLSPQDGLAEAGAIFPVLSNVLPAAHAMERRALPRERRREGFRAVSRLLTGLGRRLLVWIDDAQWADADSTDLLRELLARATTASALVLVVCFREGADEPPFVRALRAARGPWQRTEIPVEPLSDADAQALARALLGDDALPEDVARMAAESTGNPLFLSVLASLPAPQRREQTLADAILHRVGALESCERRLLERLSACAGEIPRELSYRIAASTGGRRALKRLCDLRFARWTTQMRALDVGHARIGEAVYAALSDAERRVTHAAIVEAALGWPDATPELIAEQMVRAGDPRALEALCAAADGALARLAFRQAETWLRTALAQPEAMAPALERRLRRSLAQVLSTAGRGRDAAREYLRLAQLERGAGAFDAKRAAAEQLLSAGRIDEGLGLLDEVLRAHDVRPPRSLVGVGAGLLLSRLRLRLQPKAVTTPPSPAALRRIDALAAGAGGHMLTDTLRGAWFAARELVEAERAGDPPRVLRATVFEALYLANEGVKNAARLEQRFARARGLAEATRDPSAGPLLDLAQGVGALLLGQFRQASRSLRRAEQSLTTPGKERWVELDMARRFLLYTSWFTGDVAELNRPLQRWLDDAIERGDDVGRRSFSAELSVHALYRDELEVARGQLAMLGAERRSKRFDEPAVSWLHNRMLCALYAGAPAGELLALVREMRPFWRSLLVVGQFIRVTSQSYVGQCLLASAAQTREPSLLRAVLRSARALRRERAVYATLQAELLEAGVAHLRGDDRAAIAKLDRAALGFDASGQRPSAAAARWRSAQLRGGAEGGRCLSDARLGFAAIGVQSPERMTRVLAPGFEDVETDASVVLGALGIVV